MLFNVWADTGKINYDNLGSAKLPITYLHSSKFEDKHFLDSRTKEKVSFQSRVYSTKLQLSSAFLDTTNSSLQLSIWFQPEIPYPSVDLSRIKVLTEDVYPKEYEAGLKELKY